jgi:DNA processing protein
LLREIPDAPEKLYIRGVLPPEDMKFLCVVGSRKYTPYGKEACEKLITGLRGYPVVIVSGLALGIDSIAHRAALDAGLPTVAVPGSGLNEAVLYPRAHRDLAKTILERDGALLSEFEPDFEAAPHAFPQRNRIMAGLSHATLIVEAEERSGTLITARLAADYNRDVLTVPGSIFHKHTYGPHMLLRQGAALITKSEDILEALHLTTAEKEKKVYERVSEDEKKVLELIPLPRDELIRNLKLPVSQANVLLSSMELKGLIKESLGEIRKQ